MIWMMREGYLLAKGGLKEKKKSQESWKELVTRSQRWVSYGPGS